MEELSVQVDFLTLYMNKEKKKVPDQEDIWDGNWGMVHKGRIFRVGPLKLEPKIGQQTSHELRKSLPSIRVRDLQPDKCSGGGGGIFYS